MAFEREAILDNALKRSQQNLLQEENIKRLTPKELMRITFAPCDPDYMWT